MPKYKPKYNVGDIININYYPVSVSDGYYALITSMDKDNYYFNYLDTWETDCSDIRIADSGSSITFYA